VVFINDFVILLNQENISKIFIFKRKNTRDVRNLNKTFRTKYLALTKWINISKIEKHILSYLIYI
jgi:hypothetical protein